MRAAASTLEAEPTLVPPAADAPASPRYWAFLSYSHRDRAWADRLHKALESFTFPKDLIGRAAAAGPVPARLHPIFRDRHELAASADLGGVIRQALAESRTLVVLCSPDAAQSRWVDEEVRTFRDLRPGAPVLAAIVAGTPGAGGAAECFPRALRGTEPVAADFRPGGDGWRLGRLKLAAGIVGLPLDALARREAQRRQRRLTFVAAASLAGMGVTSGLAVAAVQARNEADRQRAQAEGLVGFMLGDLRGRLEPLGRLDVLDAVGARALAYYAGQDKGVLTDEGLAQRSRALTLIGEIANLRGDLSAALRRYREALAGTGEALARAPNNPQRVFDHAQNVFWVGYIAWQRGQAAEAERRFQEYKRLADRLVALEPGKADWRLEALYADTNLGTLLLERGAAERAAAAFESAARSAERLHAANPRDRRYADGLSQALAYLADAQRGSGRLDEALATRERQLALLGRTAAAHGTDAGYTRDLTTAQQAVGHLLAGKGDPEGALRAFGQADALSNELARLEPDNAEWQAVGAGLRAARAELLLALGRPTDAEPDVRAACDIARRLGPDGSRPESWRSERLGYCLRLRAELAMNAKRPADALALAMEARRLGARGAKAGGAAALWLAAATRLAGDARAALGDEAGARLAWSQALALPSTATAPERRFEALQLLARLGRHDQARAQSAALEAVGFDYPGFDRLKTASR